MSLDSVKKALRVTADAYNSEIDALILAARADLHRMGVHETSENSALVNQAIILYCKAYFGYSEDSERYAKAYNYMATSLALSYGDNDNE